VSFTIVHRNPQTGQYTIHARIRPGHTVGPHWHRNVVQEITVLSGIYLNGWGDVWNPSGLREVRTGESVVIPKFKVHFWATREETLLQATMTGLYDIEYVLDADDPRN